MVCAKAAHRTIGIHAQQATAIPGKKWQPFWKKSAARQTGETRCGWMSTRGTNRNMRAIATGGSPTNQVGCSALRRYIHRPDFGVRRCKCVLPGLIRQRCKTRAGRFAQGIARANTCSLFQQQFAIERGVFWTQRRAERADLVQKGCAALRLGLFPSVFDCMVF